MTTPADLLRQLLNGDIVRLETTDFTVRAEVVNHQRDASGTNSDPIRDDYTLKFMPCGEDAARVEADRFRVSVEPKSSGDWLVGDLIAEVFNEETLAYESRSRGHLEEVHRLKTRE